METSSQAALQSDSQSIEELADLQRLMAGAVMMPLTSGGRMQRQWTDGRLMRDVADSFIKPSNYLSAYGRLEVYNRQYWARLIDCLYEDFPGLVAVLGERKFDALAIAYLSENPSTSFTLRNLGSKMSEFLDKNPEMFPRRYDIAKDMARLEWAHIQAFDSDSLETIEPDQVLGVDPSKVRMRLQPHLQLLEFGYAVDEMLLNIRRSNSDQFREDVSNAKLEKAEGNQQRAQPAPRKEDVFLAVHRHKNAVFYKRLRIDEYYILSSLDDGDSLESALEKGARKVDGPIADWTAELRKSFQDWTQLGWFAPAE